MAKRVRQNREAIEAEEDLVIDAHLLIQRLLNETRMSRADLAKAMGVSQARLSQVMAVDANPTLRTLAQIFFAMDRKLVLDERSIKVGQCQLETKSAETLWHREEKAVPKPTIGSDAGRGQLAALAKRAIEHRRSASHDSYCNDNDRGLVDIELLAA